MMRGVRASSTRIEFDLVDDGEGVRTLDHLRHVVFHVVAQIVEAELVVRAVGDVGGIGLAALLVVEPVHDHADREPEERVDLAHPRGVATGEVVVDGDDVHAFAGERIQIDRQGGDERLAFAGAHFRDRPFVEHHAADQLDVEMALLQGALGRLANSGEGGGENVVERLSRLELSPEFVGLGPQLLVGQRRKPGLERIDRGDLGPVALEATVVRRTEHPFHHRVELHGGEHHLPFQCRSAGLLRVPSAGSGKGCGRRQPQQKARNKAKRPSFAPLNRVGGEIGAARGLVNATWRPTVPQLPTI